MSAKAIELMNEYIGAARANPDQAPEICRRAAQTFADFASGAKNPKEVKFLTNIGFEFAGVAAKAQQQQATTSDFVQLMRDTEQALDELGPEAAMSSNATMDATAIQRTNAISQAHDISIQPRSFLNKDATLGRVASVTFAPTQEQTNKGIFQRQTIAFWQGSKRESQAMSVDLGTVLVPDASEEPGLITDSRPYAEIQYGADGNTQNSVTIDVGLGRRLTVIGNYISVLAGMDSPRQVVIPGFPIISPVLSIGASISTFAAPSIAPVTRTIYIDDLAPMTTSRAFRIPLRAVQMLPPLAASMTDDLQVNFATYSGAVIGTWECLYSPTTPFLPPYPIPTDAYFITVRSALGVGPSGGGPILHGIRIPFELSL